MFQIGQKVRHRASGEIGILVESTPDGWVVSTGFDRGAVIPEVLLELAEQQPPQWLAGNPSTGTMQAYIDGKVQEVAVLGRIGLGLACRSGSGIHLVLESHAVDREGFRRLMEAIPAMKPG